MKNITVTLGLFAALLTCSLHAKDSNVETQSQADKVRLAFDQARQAQREKPSPVKKAAGILAEGLVDNEKYWDPRGRDGNPADRRGPLFPTPVQNAQDAVSRPAPQ